MKIPKGKVFVLMVVALALVIYFYPRPLTKQLGFEQFESKISADILRSKMAFAV